MIMMLLMKFMMNWSRITMMMMRRRTSRRRVVMPTIGKDEGMGACCGRISCWMMMLLNRSEV